MSTESSNVIQKPRSLVVRTGERFGVEPEKLMSTLKATAFRGDVSVEQMMALLVVADQYNLNPFTKEIYAFPDSRNGIVPIVGVDGWARIINENASFDGLEFTDGPNTEDGIPEWIECKMFRKDRSHPISVREYLLECRREKSPAWTSHPRRMLRHKALIQCARLAFAYVGIYDEDEAERIVAATAPDLGPRSDTKDVDPALCDQRISQITDILAQDKPETEIAESLREANAELMKFPELAQTVFDGLAARGIIKKAKYREYLKL
jgi:phage recombination protein Bet